MKNNWQTKKLGEVLERIVGGGTPSKSNPAYWGGDIPWASVKDIKENESILEQTQDFITEAGLKDSSANVVPAGTLILPTRMGLGRVVRTKIKTAINQDLKALFPKKELNTDYLLLFLKSKANEIIEKGSGATVSGIRLEHLKEIEIPLPPLEEQKEIVKILDEKMGRIAEAKRLRAEALADTEKILPQTLHEIFEEGKKNGWEEKAISEICKVNPTKSEAKNIQDSEKISFVQMSSVSDIDQLIKTQVEKDFGEVKKGYTYFSKGDILFAKITPCMENGKIAHAKNLNHEIGFGSTEFHILRANKNLILPEFIYEIVRSKKFRIEASQKMTGSAGQKRVPKDFIENYRIILPPLAEQQKIITKLDALSEKVRTLRDLQTTQLADLKSLEKAYLREAFKGEDVIK